MRAEPAGPSQANRAGPSQPGRAQPETFVTGVLRDVQQKRSSGSSSRRNNTSQTYVRDVLQGRRQRRSSATLIEDIVRELIKVFVRDGCQGRHERRSTGTFVRSVRHTVAVRKLHIITRGPNPQKQPPDSSATPESQPSRGDFGYRTTGYTYSLMEPFIWCTRHLADNVVHKR